MAVTPIRLLTESPVFAGLTPSTLENFMRDCPLRDCAEGEYFFQEGDDGKSMFVLFEGAAKVYKGRGAERRMLNQLSEGDCFGEMALIDRGPRSAAVQAVTAARALELTSDVFYGLKVTNLSQFTEMYMNISRGLSRRLRAGDERLFAILDSRRREQ